MAGNSETPAEPNAIYAVQRPLAALANIIESERGAIKGVNTIRSWERKRDGTPASWERVHIVSEFEKISRFSKAFYIISAQFLKSLGP